MDSVSLGEMKAIITLAAVTIRKRAPMMMCFTADVIESTLERVSGVKFR